MLTAQAITRGVSAQRRKTDRKVNKGHTWLAHASFTALCDCVGRLVVSAGIGTRCWNMLSFPWPIREVGVTCASSTEAEDIVKVLPGERMGGEDGTGGLKSYGTMQDEDAIHQALELFASMI
jgi:hypothetical protein